MQTSIVSSNVTAPRADLERPPTLPREDLYGAVHKGLRWLFCQTMVQLGRTRFADETSAQRAVAEVNAVLDICLSHLAHENRHLHSAIERRRPGAIARLADDHEGHEACIAKLRVLSERLLQASPEARPAWGRRLYLRFTAFVGENLVHMVEEEELAQGVLEEIYSLDELRSLHHAIVSSVEPTKMLPFMQIMLAGVDAGERSEMLSNASNALPTAATAKLVADLRGRIDDHEWGELSRRFAVSSLKGVNQ